MLIPDNSAVWYTEVIRLQWMSASFDLKWCEACYWNYHPPHFMTWKDVRQGSPCLNSCRPLLHVISKNMALLIQILIFWHQASIRILKTQHKNTFYTSHLPLNHRLLQPNIWLVFSIKKPLPYLDLPMNLMHELHFRISLVPRTFTLIGYSRARVYFISG